MKEIPTILRSDEMLDKAFRRVKKVMITDQRGFNRTRAETLGKLSALANTLAAQLNRYVRAFPSLDRLHPFERELIDVVVGLDELRHALGAIDWARKTIEISRTSWTTYWRDSATWRISKLKYRSRKTSLARAMSLRSPRY